MHRNRFFVAVFAVVFAVAAVSCKKKDEPPKPKEDTSSSATASASTPTSSPNDDVTTQLRKVAGSDAKDCGTVAAQGDVAAATQCAMQTNEASKPFFVRYELPLPGSHMSIATARAADGKLYTVQYSSDGYKQAPEGGTISADKKLITQPCPGAPLRVAGSGRVTCFAPQQNAANMSSPHGGGMAMPPASGTNPHGKAQSNTPLNKSH